MGNRGTAKQQCSPVNGVIVKRSQPLHLQQGQGRGGCHTSTLLFSSCVFPHVYTCY